MRIKEREGLIVLLAATAGSTDAWSYFVLGHVFIANMTGNTVLLGVAISQGRWAGIARPAFAIGCYAIGVFLGALLTRGIDTRVVWPARVNRVLALEAVLLLAGSLAWLHVAPGTQSEHHALVGVSAVALGLQSAAMQALKLPGIVTTYITGTWTTLFAGLASLLRGGARERSARKPMLMQTAVLATYCSGAAISGVLARDWQWGLGLLPAAAVTLVVTYAACFGRESHAPLVE